MIRRIMTAAAFATSIISMSAYAQAPAPSNTRPADATTDQGTRPGAQAPSGAPGVGVDRQDRREQRTDDQKRNTTDQGASGTTQQAPPGAPDVTTRQDQREQRTNDRKQQSSDPGTAGSRPMR